MTVFIKPRLHDLGDLQVRRLIPTLQARSSGPFVFADHMGPAIFSPGKGMDVRPHPHIGLATVTFLWDGAIGHRDSLGSNTVITPGDVNLMVAGRGIVHSERTPAALRANEHHVHGMQTWIALPKESEEVAPAFYHHTADILPVQQRAGASVRVLLGRAYGEESPAKTFSETLNVALDLDAGAEIALDDSHVERVLYILEGQAQLDGKDIPVQELIIPAAGKNIKLRALTPIKAMLMGGEPLDAHRHLWWNFVSSSKERLEQAKLDWQEGRMGRIEGDEEFIPLPV